MPPEVMTRPEVVSIIVAVLVALGGALVAFATAAKRWADSKFTPIAKAVQETKAQAVNNHGPDGKDINLRDQIDTIQREMREGFRRMDHQFGEVHDRDVQTTHRIENLEERAEADHKQLRVEIARKRDK